MKKKVQDFLERYQLTDKTIVVGFSGGHDSMCLMDIMYQLSQTNSFKLIGAHFNHNWRGEEAKQEEENCRKFCEERGIIFFSKTASANLKHSEMVARVVRYSFFDDVIKEYNADAFLTAHNKDDNAETLIYRIIKGSGLTGLKGIAEKRDKFYRPLLNATRKEIDAYCKKNNLCPNEDSSNNNPKYKRNFIRHSILPLMKEINPKVVDAFHTLSQRANDDSAIINEYIDRIKEKLLKDDVISTVEFVKLSLPVKRRIIYDLITSLNLEYDSKKVDEILGFIEKYYTTTNGRKKSLGTGLWVFVSSKAIELVRSQEKDEQEISITKEGEYEFGDYIFSIEKYNHKGKLTYPKDSDCIAYIDIAQVGFDFLIRTRQDGDIINPLGMHGVMKLKKYLISKKIPQHKRDYLVLLCNKDEVLWVAGLGLSNKISTKTDPTHKISLRKK